MLLSKYFLPILKENSKDATIISHNLMLRAGLIRQTVSGIYTWLPLGLKVLNKVFDVVKNEMDRAEALQLLMPTIQSADIWQESGRYESYGLELLRIKDRHQKDLLYGPTNEEQITKIFKDNIKSYKNLPLNLYHIQWKFRDEIRPRFGVMRGREFLMKDAYSFDVSEHEASISYKKMFTAYLRIFKELSLTAIPMKADNGDMGGELSHEFMILAETGESQVYFDKALQQQELVANTINYNTDPEKIFQAYTGFYAVTEEKHNPTDPIFLIKKDNIISGRGIEIGHIFYLGTKYSETLGAKVLDKNGKNIDVCMGCYGIGISRLLGAIIEVHHDSKGIIWPKSIAPFKVIINALGQDANILATSLQIYNSLINAGIDALYNDKDDSAGVKLATADLIGIPYQINIGKQSLAQGNVELKNRSNNVVSHFTINNMVELVKVLQS